MDFTPLRQQFALLALVFMMSYVFLFDKLRWQLKHPHHQDVQNRPLPTFWGEGSSSNPFRK